MNRCDTCKELKEDVIWTTDPYQNEINDVDDWAWFCADCWQERADDI